MRIEEYVLCFFIYAFLGYVCEVIYCSIGQKKFVNRGYLYMPICPIYGYGALLIILSMNPLFERNMWYLILILGILLTSLLEYLTSYVMEVCFHMRWWDYSKRKFNINGRVCLRNSLMFGALVMVVMYGIQPLMVDWLGKLSDTSAIIVSGVLVLALIVDTILSTIKNINISKLTVKLTGLFDEASEIISEKKEAAIEYFSNTTVVQKIKNLSSHYPTLKISRRENRINKRWSLKELISKHFTNRDDTK